ncbi:MAG TPA: tetratricopeptide repeat protein [Sedimentisphaerales bacterium]|mgnify:CR=1 FL=1|nr:tetratricopeptide repeat protein [Sedimentisphaerales bacterium]HRV49843.1 tetratricopeptide repeat protein [Sedimentisphaerales bacterium]
MGAKDGGKCSDGLGGAPGTESFAVSRPDGRQDAKPRRWHERTSVTLCVAAGLVLVAFGFVHVITGVVSPLGLPLDFAWKQSFGYRETFVDARTIQALPYLAAKTRYPLSCEALQRRGYLPSGREFEAHWVGRRRENMRRWQAQFAGSLDRPPRPWQDRLRSEPLVVPAAAEDAGEYNRRGIVLAWDGRYEEAIAQFSRAIQRNPVFVDACYNRALVYVAIGNLGPAVSDFGRVIEIVPQGVEGYESRGRLHLEMGRYDEAISDFERVIELDSRHAEAHFLRALACYAKGQYDKAWESVERLQRLGCAVPAGFVTALHDASGPGGLRRKGPVRR